MNALVAFDFDGEPVRAVLIDGEPHLVAADVTARLGYINMSDALARHCKGVVKRYPLWTPGGMQEVRVLAEPDVWRLIIASKLPAAERFERKVFEEILPTIRRTGAYGVQRDPMELLDDPDVLRGLLVKQLDRAAASEAQIAIMAPKAAAHDRLGASKGSVCITDAAKPLRTTPRALFEWLKREKWIFKRASKGSWIAFQRRLDAGHLEHLVTTVAGPDGIDRARTRVVVTMKGLTRLAELLGVELDEGEEQLKAA